MNPSLGGGCEIFTLDILTGGWFGPLLNFKFLLETPSTEIRDREPCRGHVRSPLA
jgi:hypothetical protein